MLHDRMLGRAISWSWRKYHPLARKGYSMRLRPWCRERDLTLSDFARLIRCRPQVVHKWIEGSIPDPKYMRQIYRVTQGQVCPNRRVAFHRKPRWERRMNPWQDDQSARMTWCREAARSGARSGSRSKISQTRTSRARPGAAISSVCCGLLDAARRELALVGDDPPEAVELMRGLPPAPGRVMTGLVNDYPV